MGDGRYALTLTPTGVTFEVDRLRRSSHELWGELNVRINGTMGQAKTVEGSLSLADMNLSSDNARRTRAKVLSERSRAEALDWAGFVEELCVRVIAAERQGSPATRLCNEAEPTDSTETWDLCGWPLLQDHPTVLFGQGDACKSYLAMWAAGSLARQGVPVLYIDWEFSKKDHRRRFGKLFQPMPKEVFYMRCDRPIPDEIDRIIRTIHQEGCQYAVLDSMGFACEKGADTADQAGIYFRAVRQLGIGNLNISHVTKTPDANEPAVYGSIYFSLGARSIWYIERATQNPIGKINVGLFHKKSNTGERLTPKGFQFAFTSQTTTVKPVSVESVDELAAKLPMLDRIKKLLDKGAQTSKGIAGELGTTVSIVEQTIAKHTSNFVRLGPKIGLKSSEIDF